MATCASVFVNGIPPSMKNLELYNLFAQYGKIHKAWIKDGKCHGYVVFESEEEAAGAIDKLHGFQIADYHLIVTPFVKMEERYNKLYVSNLDRETTEEEIRDVFGEFGDITRIKLIRNSKGVLSSAFVYYALSDPGRQAVEELDGFIIHRKPISVVKARPLEYETDEQPIIWKEKRLRVDLQENQPNPEVDGDYFAAGDEDLKAVEPSESYQSNLEEENFDIF